MFVTRIKLPNEIQGIACAIFLAKGKLEEFATKPICGAVVNKDGVITHVLTVHEEEESVKLRDLPADISIYAEELKNKMPAEDFFREYQVDLEEFTDEEVKSFVYAIGFAITDQQPENGLDRKLA